MSPHSQVIPFQNVHVSLNSSKLKIALVQFKDSLKQKDIVQLSNGKKSYEWRATADTEARKLKALNLLDWFNVHSKPDIVIFPEYSFPVVQALDDLQERCNRYNQIVIGGADSILESGGIYNKCPVIMPNQNIAWISKRFPSQFEDFLSSPSITRLPRFVWTHGGQEYWFLVFICLDFLNFALQDVILNDLGGPGLFFVPMCSKVIGDFLSFASALFRRPGGTATILSNCVGTAGAGNSALCAVHPSLLAASPSEPVFRLSKSSECFAVFEIDLSRLSPPRVSTTTTKSSLSNTRIFKVQSGSDGKLTITGGFDPVPKTFIRGVVNPDLFTLSGKKMRIAFLEVQSYATVKAQTQDKPFETLAVLGHCDLIITHVHQSATEMVFDITKGEGMAVKNITKTTGHDPESFEPFDNKTDNLIPFFEVDKYYKVLGVSLGESETQITQIPSGGEELSEIIALGQNWDSGGADGDTKEKCLNNKWILAKTERQPGVISAIVTIALANRTDNFHSRWWSFEQRILPRIVRSDAVTSCYGGTGHFITCDFLLRVTTGVDNLFQFIEELHDWADEAHELILTSTYVVFNKLSDLALDNILKTEPLSARDEILFEKILSLYLSPKDTLKFNALTRQQKEEILSNYKAVQQEAQQLTKLAEKGPGWSRERLQITLATGIINFFYSSIHANGGEISPSAQDEEDFSLTALREVHDFLREKAENILSRHIDKIASDRFEVLKTIARIQAQREKSELTYTDKVKLSIEAAKAQSPAFKANLDDFQNLYDTIQCRNVFAHGKKEELEKLGVTGYTSALVRYLRFLQKFWR